MKVGSKGIALVKKWEGCYLTAYQDSVGVWTIGYGTTKYPNGTKVKRGDKITQAQAESYLSLQVQQHADGMNKYLDVSILNQNQYDALASFHYNLGRDILKGSSLLQYLKKKDWNKATAEMLLYNKGRINGVLTVLRGLQNRRNAEVELFKAPVKKTTIKDDKQPAKTSGFTRYTVTATELNIRKSPSATSKILGTLKKGQTVQVVKISDGWAKINSGSTHVYVSAKYIKK